MTAAPSTPTPTEKRTKIRPVRDWYSGWCTAFGCQDGKTDSRGDTQRRCLGMARNGEKIEPRYLYCACTCHVDCPDAAQPVRHHDETAVEAEAGPAAEEDVE